MLEAIMEDSEHFDDLEFFNVHLNLSTLAASIFLPIKNAAAAARIRSCDLKFSSRAP